MSRLVNHEYESRALLFETDTCSASSVAQSYTRSSSEDLNIMGLNLMLFFLAILKPIWFW